MKNTYLIIINFLFLITISACTSAPVKKETILAEEPRQREVITTTYECYGDPNMESPTTLKEKLHDGTDLNGTILNCNGTTVIIDTILDYGPDQVNILDITTGKWTTYTTQDCRILSHQ